MAKLNVERLLLKARQHVTKGELDQARRIYLEILEAFPKNNRVRQALEDLGTSGLRTAAAQPPETVLNEVIGLYGERRFEELRAELPKLLEQYPHAMMLWNIQGAVGRVFRDLGAASEAFRQVTRLSPDYADGHNNLGVVLQEQGRIDAAIESYEQALKAKPDYAEACYNLANALAERGDLDAAVKRYAMALDHKPGYAEAYYNLANILKRLGRHDTATAAFVRAATLAPRRADTYNNLGVSIMEQGRGDTAIRNYLRALRLDPRNPEVHNNLGNLLKEQGAFEAAVDHYGQAIGLKPDYADAHYNLGNAWKELGKPDLAVESYAEAIRRNPKLVIAKAEMIHQVQRLCDWSRLRERASDLITLGISGGAVPPFFLLAADDNARRHKLRCQNWARQVFGTGAPLPIARPTTRPERLRIGYFSADFHDHATLYLMAGLLREHDRSRFEIHAYSYGRTRAGDYRARAADNVDGFHDVQGLTDTEIADLVHGHDLDIAVDLKGHTKDTRTGVFVHRLAPLQINYLGYPGTLGADFIDYLIADRIVIPDAERSSFTENVIYLPDSYQPNDNRREISNLPTERADFGLPDGGFVFCCFNNSYKITSTEFDIWMRLLRACEGSVLWLLRSNGWVEINLREEAEARGVSGDRIIFSERIPPAEHLARHRHADLFLDTFNCNAHTTASDALWAGLPMVTKLGSQFAARVGGSLASAVGLAELVVETERDYEEMALGLAKDPVRLSKLRDSLIRNRPHHPLFDTKRYTRHFEQALDAVFQRHIDGLDPADIEV